MTPFTTTLVTIFGIIVYMMMVDKNVSDYIVLQSKLLRVNIERLYWVAVYHPNNFITTWVNNRKYDKIAKDLHKQFNSDKEG